MAELTIYLCQITLMCKSDVLSDHVLEVDGAYVHVENCSIVGGREMADERHASSS